MGNNLIDKILKFKTVCPLEQQLCVQAGFSLKECLIIEKLQRSETMTAREIAVFTGLSPSRTSRILDKLFRENAVTREFDPEDRRRITVSLTEKGVALADKFCQSRQLCLKDLEGRFSKEELKTVHQGLDLLLASSG